MRYLFLDDERMPGDVTWISIPSAKWEIVRSLDEAVEWVKKNGFPDAISFDHDLGLMHYAEDYSDEKTGFHFAKWLVEYDMDTNSMPAHFRYTVHSKNPVGAKNIKELLDRYIRFKNDRT
jgi:hypothetical protein